MERIQHICNTDTLRYITTYGRVLDPEEAYEVAFKAGQLLSENNRGYLYPGILDRGTDHSEGGVD